ncbi:hypothetical protein FACS1894164_12180 [Spirochaetia bacterium]|nr:hypothetical protein FACS1894164_12180 [Spirochaetia bacterium]
MVNWKYFLPSLKIGLIWLACAGAAGFIGYCIGKALGGEFAGRVTGVAVACVVAVIGAFVEAKLLKKINE